MKRQFCFLTEDMAHIASTLILVIVGISTVASMTVMRRSNDRRAACGQECQAYINASPESMNKCLRYVCRQNVFQYYMRVGKRDHQSSSLLDNLVSKQRAILSENDRERLLQNFLQYNQQEEERERPRQIPPYHHTQHQTSMPMSQDDLKFRFMDEDDKFEDEERGENIQDPQIGDRGSVFDSTGVESSKSSFHGNNAKDFYGKTFKALFSANQLQQDVLALPDLESSETLANKRHRMTSQIRRKLSLLFPHVNFSK